MAIVEGIVAVFTVLSIISFIGYLIGLARAPSGERPEVPTMNRFGEELPPAQNPGYEETEDEHH